MNFNIYRNQLEWIRIWKIIDSMYEGFISKNNPQR